VKWWDGHVVHSGEAQVGPKPQKGEAGLCSCRLGARCEINGGVVNLRAERATWGDY
jgi:hypothetical protein